MWPRTSTRCCIALFTLAIVTVEAGLLRVPKIYNTVITSDANLEPSRAYPIIQPVLSVGVQPVVAAAPVPVVEDHRGHAGAYYPVPVGGLYPFLTGSNALYSSPILYQPAYGTSQHSAPYPAADSGFASATHAEKVAPPAQSQFRPPMQPHLDAPVKTQTHFQPQMQQPQVQPVIQSSSQLEPQFQPQSQSQGQFQAQIQLRPLFQPETQSHPQFQPQTHSQPQFQSQTHLQPQFQPQTQSQPQFQPQTHSQSQFQPQTYSQPQFQPQTHSQPQFQPQTHSQPQIQSQPQVQFQPQQSQFQPEAQFPSQPQPRPQAQQPPRIPPMPASDVLNHHLKNPEIPDVPPPPLPVNVKKQM